MIPMSLREQVSLLVFGAALLAVYGAEIGLWIGYLLNRFHRRRPGKILLAKAAIVVHVLAAIGLLAFLYGYFIEPCWIDVNVVPIRTTKLASATFRIVHISDLHVDTTPRNEEAAVRIINGLEPDLIVVTGDFLNDAGAVPRLKGMLGRLEAPLGKLAVAGNFEQYYWPDMDLLAGTGFRLLERETVVAAKGSESLGVFGMGYVPSDHLGEPLEDLPADRFNLFLFHTPDLVEDLSEQGIDLYLCGHTHGGQVAMPLYGALITFSKFGKKYESGMYQVGDTVLYVNRGLGMEPRPAPQMRFFARPEITVFDIQPELLQDGR